MTQNPPATEPGGVPAKSGLPVEGVGRRTAARPAGRAALLSGLLCGAVTLSVLMFANWSLITSPIIEDSDFAANSLLVDQAESFRLLVGNYSRFGFNHPGPTLLYSQAFGDILVHRMSGIAPSSFGGQFVGILVLNSCCVGVVCTILHSVTGRWSAAVAMLALLPLINVWEPYALATTWMPGAYIAPFLLMTVAAAAVAAGRWAYLWALIAGASLCVHGHVAFVMFAVVTVGTAVAVGWLRVRRGAAGPTRRQVLLSAFVLVFFLLPIVVNLLLHWPGEFAKYLGFVGSASVFTPRTWSEVAAFIGSYWVRSGGWMLGLLVLAGGLAVVARMADRGNPGVRFRLVVIGFAALETALFAVYAARGVDDLQYHYVGWFILTAPLLVLWAGLDAVMSALDRRSAPRGRWAGAILCAVLAAGLLTAGRTANPYRGMPAAVAQALPAGDVRISFHLDGWPAGLGLLEHARRQGAQACVDGQMWAFLVTPALVCSDAGPGRRLLVLGPGEPRPEHVIFDDGSTALVAN